MDVLEKFAHSIKFLSSIFPVSLSGKFSGIEISLRCFFKEAVPQSCFVG